MARRRRQGVAAAAVALGLVLGACSGSEGQDDQPAAGPAEPAGGAPAEVALPALAEAVPDEPVRVGLLVTLRSEPGEGQDLVAAAEGAAVAAYRLRLGGADVELEVVDDQGTTQGATEAVQEMLDAEVAGIVAATRGEHLDDALVTATDAGTPVLLPYDRSGALPTGAFATGPSATAVDRALLAGMEADGLERPYVLSADGVEADGVGSADAAAVGQDVDGAVEAVAAAFDEGRVDSVLVAAAASTQARVVAVLQGAAPQVPVVLTPEALSPAFADGLAESSGTTAGAFLSAGPDAGDATTLAPGERAESASVFFAALRMAAGDPASTDLFDAAPFAEVASGADTASHDAVVALAAAVREAGSTEAGDVLSALSGLQVGPADGLAGPGLDFGSDQALPAEAVVVLRATGQDPGVRPAPRDADPRLFWFAADTTG